MQKTRRQILDFLKRNGTASLEELGREIGLSAVTIRAHLGVLERDDLVASDEVRGKVGRPHFVYALSDGARAHFPASYDLIAHRFLEGFTTLFAEEQVGRVIEWVAERWAAEKAGRLAGRDLEARVGEVARIRSEEGAMAEWECCDGAYLIHQHHCPASLVAASHPEVCRVELEYMRRILGARVERETHRVAGELRCSYRVEV